MLANGMRYVPEVQPLGQRRSVFKVGAASGYTQGVLDSNYYEGQVEYVQPRTRTAMFSHLLQVTPSAGSPRFSRPGDSGALVVDSLTGRAVGLVIAGASQSYVCPIGPILSALGAELYVAP